MWFLAISPSYGRSWLPKFLESLLRNEEPVLDLLRDNPFPDQPPKLVRAHLYRYRFNSGEERRTTGRHWSWTKTSEVIHPLTLDDLH